MAFNSSFNIILIGDTGVGKTHILKTLVPGHIYDIWINIGRAHVFNETRNEIVRLNIQDVSFQYLEHVEIQGTHCVVIIGSPEKVENLLHEWILKQCGISVVCMHPTLIKKYNTILLPRPAKYCTQIDIIKAFEMLCKILHKERQEILKLHTNYIHKDSTDKLQRSECQRYCEVFT